MSLDINDTSMIIDPKNKQRAIDALRAIYEYCEEMDDMQRSFYEHLEKKDFIAAGKVSEETDKRVETAKGFIIPLNDNYNVVCYMYIDGNPLGGMYKPIGAVNGKFYKIEAGVDTELSIPSDLLKEFGEPLTDLYSLDTPCHYTDQDLWNTLESFTNNRKFFLWVAESRIKQGRSKTKLLREFDSIGNLYYYLDVRLHSTDGADHHHTNRDDTTLKLSILLDANGLKHLYKSIRDGHSLLHESISIPTDPEYILEFLCENCTVERYGLPYHCIRDVTISVRPFSDPSKVLADSFIATKDHRSGCENIADRFEQLQEPLLEVLRKVVRDTSVFSEKKENTIAQMKGALQDMLKKLEQA